MFGSCLQGRWWQSLDSPTLAPTVSQSGALLNLVHVAHQREFSVSLCQWAITNNLENEPSHNQLASSLCKCAEPYELLCCMT